MLQWNSFMKQIPKKDDFNCKVCAQHRCFQYLLQYNCSSIIWLRPLLALMGVVFSLTMFVQPSSTVGIRLRWSTIIHYYVFPVNSVVLTMKISFLDICFIWKPHITTRVFRFAAQLLKDNHRQTKHITILVLVCMDAYSEPLHVLPQTQYSTTTSTLHRSVPK